ncbi:MAG: glycosyltransferase [Candidatus Omnitrophica bacterium]|nr:glycosyltransferase [Candidatus Omnitrophota bacterium]
MDRKILLMYISEKSGHHQASIALEKAILKKKPMSSVRKINAFKYTNPLIEILTHKAYMRLIKRRPRVWGRLYDNQSVITKTERFRRFVNNVGSKKIQKLINAYKPDAIVCTQAYPCGIVANFKKRYAARIPLIGALTDFAPHSYWIYDDVDAYIVPSDEVKDKFVKKGVPQQKINVLGTPINPEFEIAVNKQKVMREYGLSETSPIVLVMGGTHGIGPNEHLINELGRSEMDFQIIVVTGINRKFLKKIKKISKTYSKKIIALGFADNIHELMDISTVIMTKPGGLTIAEALAKSLPIIITNPLPGQEDLNTIALTSKGAAVRAESEKDAVKILEELLSNRTKIEEIKKNMRSYAQPSSSSRIADLLFNMTN